MLKKMNKKGQADIMAGLTSVFSTWWTYAVLALAVGMGYFSATLKRANLKPKTAMALFGVIALIVFMGIGAFGVGTISASSVAISQIQTTTDYVMRNSSGATISDSGDNNQIQSDFYTVDGFMTGDADIDGGAFLVTRKGTLTPNSCAIKVIKPARYDISDVTYHLVNEDATTGKMTAYVYTGATTDAADNTHPKETNQLAFADGVNQGYVSFNISIDETGVDALSQYDSRSVRVNMCDYLYTFKIHQASA